MADKEKTLLHFSQLPKFLQHNEAIHEFYRPCMSARDTFLTLFSLHNETLNIWTHLLGFMIFGVLMIISFFTWLEHGDLMDKTVFLIFVLSAQLLLLLSSFFHLFYSMSKSESEYTWFARLDYIGISILISGSFYSPIYYTFSCYPLLVMFFNGGITLLGIGAICVTFHPAFEKPGYDAIRASVFVGMALFGVTCAPIAIYLFGVESLWGIAWRLLVMGACYLIGVVFYVSKFPECKYPGKFDRCSSHTIWHVWVILGTLAQYFVCRYGFLSPQPCSFFPSTL